MLQAVIRGSRAGAADPDERRAWGDPFNSRACCPRVRWQQRLKQNHGHSPMQVQPLHINAFQSHGGRNGKALSAANRPSAGSVRPRGDLYATSWMSLGPPSRWREGRGDGWCNALTSWSSLASRRQLEGLALGEHGPRHARVLRGDGHDGLPVAAPLGVVQPRVTRPGARGAGRWKAWPTLAPHFLR